MAHEASQNLKHKELDDGKEEVENESSAGQRAPSTYKYFVVFTRTSTLLLHIPVAPLLLSQLIEAATVYYYVQSKRWPTGILVLYVLTLSLSKLWSNSQKYLAGHPGFNDMTRLNEKKLNFQLLLMQSSQRYVE